MAAGQGLRLGIKSKEERKNKGGNIKERVKEKRGEKENNEGK